MTLSKHSLKFQKVQFSIFYQLKNKQISNIKLFLEVNYIEVFCLMTRSSNNCFANLNFQCYIKKKCTIIHTSP